MGSQQSNEGWLLEERFLCKECIKAHNQVESWIAEDTLTGENVFVKLALTSRLGLSNRLRLSHESKLLRKLESSSLAKVLQFGETEELVYLVTEYIPGTDLGQLLAQGPLGQGTTASIAVRILEALEEVHQEGILHRDIKPSNIKVPSPRSATLVDFGLSKARDEQPREFGTVTGSLLYMAPEQLGLLTREISAATDLYSLGVVLYECLAGKPPFWSGSLSELLRKHLTQAPPPLREFRTDISESFERFIRRLLRKEPQDRFGSASQALEELQEFNSHFKVERPLKTSTSHPGLRQIHAPFVGRYEQRKQLLSALEDTKRGRASSVAVVGNAGTGKTRLLDDLVLRAVERGFSIYRGRGTEEESRGPFSLLEGIADKISSELGQNSDRLEALQQNLGEQAEILAATFPSLRLLGGAEKETEPEVTPWLEAKILRALRNLLQHISSADSPSLFIMDDIHWADLATRHFVVLWNSELSSAKDCHSLLVIGTRPAEEVATVSSSCTAKLELPPFTSAELDELFCSLGSQISGPELRAVRELTGGNPLMAVETLRELSKTELDDKPQPSQRLQTLQAKGLFASRVGRVSDSTRRILQLAAQLGQSFQPQGLGYAAELDNADVFECLSEAKEESLVWEDATTGNYYFLHDRIKQHLSKTLDETAKKALHLRYAKYLSQELPDGHYELAFHYDLAEEWELASENAVLAARAAYKRNALETSIFYFRIAKKNPELAQDAKLQEELADCCMLVGEYNSALDLYRESLEQASENLGRARLLGKLGELHQKMGLVGEASRSILEAIQLLGGQVPTSALGRRAETAWRIGLELFRPSEKAHSRQKKKSSRSLLLARLYSRLSYVWFWTHGQADLLFIHLRHLQEAAYHPESRELAQAYASHAIACIGAYQFERAQRFAELSLSLRQKLGDSWGEAHAYNTLGIVLYAATRVNDCIEVVRRAETLLDAAGDLWELAVCRYNLALCYYRQGQLSRAREPAKRAYLVGLECGDVQASGVSLGVLVRCSPLEISEDQLDRELESPDLDSATKAWLLEAKGIRWLALDQPSKAIRELEESWSISKRLGRKTEYVASSPCWLATAYRKQVEKLPPFAVRERKELLLKLQKTVKTAVKWGRKFRNNLAHSLREQAYSKALQGKTKESLSSLKESLATAEELGFKQELALTLKAQLQLREALGISLQEIEDSSKASLDYASLLDFGTHPSVSQLERFRQVLDVAAKLTKSDSYEAIFEVMGQSAQALFRTEDCVILENQSDKLVVLGTEESDGTVSQTLVLHALELGLPATGVNDLPLTESLIMAEIRATLCIPFGSKDTRLCCIQLTQQSVGHIFAEEEIRLATYLSSLGTAAVESVASREAVREAEKLEQKHQQQLELLDARRDGLVQSLGIASHDLKNLIFIVESVSRGLLGSPSEEDLERTQGFLQLICRKASWMVNIYLDVTQAHNTGSIPCNASVFDLAELGQDVTDFLNKSLTLESQEPRIEFSGKTALVVGDKDRLWQAVANIVGNALTHTPFGSPVKVVVTEEGELGSLSVIDQGAGIPLEIQQSIFDPFVQAKRQAKGSGLGLWIAKLIVESSSGFLELESQLDKGSTFTILLKSDQQPASLGGE